MVNKQLPKAETTKSVGENLLPKPSLSFGASVNNLFEITSTVDRNLLWAAQTPQVFRFNVISDAYRKAEIEGTDDSAIVEQFYPVNIVFGSPLNLKVTVAEDIPIMESVLKSLVEVDKEMDIN